MKIHMKMCGINLIFLFDNFCIASAKKNIAKRRRMSLVKNTPAEKSAVPVIKIRCLEKIGFLFDFPLQNSSSFNSGFGSGIFAEIFVPKNAVAIPLKVLKMRIAPKSEKAPLPRYSAHKEICTNALTAELKTEIPYAEMKSLSNFLCSRLFATKRKYIAAALETLCDIETRKNGVTSVPPMSDEATAFISESFMNLKKLIFPERSARIIAAFASPILKNGNARGRIASAYEKSRASAEKYAIAFFEESE